MNILRNEEKICFKRTYNLTKVLQNIIEMQDFFFNEKNQTERKEKLLASRISNIHTICGKYVQLARRLRIINSLLVDFVPSLTK
jgi:uncharacterized LabA/DUF88 family protein